MTVFFPTLVAEDGVAKIRSTTLGDNTNQFKSEDVGALVKLSGSNYVLCADGDAIEGQVCSIELATRNDGHSFGAVKMSHRIKVLKGNLNPEDYAVAGVQTLGTTAVGVAKQSAGGGATPGTYAWRCIYTDATHAILEKV